ncbi:histidine triad (HIT) family hydrolase [Geotalea daltonii FRC-32]|uniref:Histidine triad (HIT) family hydrolase n=1 Tax=Geotalea daltonii (strain DSM 22248 / JCM 15807 / FRC-32) TaxID=316067 RepID=B9M4N2_GEODF|nr:HIT family protein [Geotalea daltonii]ACM19758.1 histidine triad (HIT) family hydrolase [Geotalea daltonii FRC-32]
MTCPMCSKWNDEPHLRVAELEHCLVMLNRDQFFPGYTFVFTRSHVTELFHLDRAARTAVMEEVSAVAATLYKLFQPAKINYELLGNMVPHMHWHIVPRFAEDPLWPRPIWSEPHQEIILGESEYAERTRLIGKTLLSIDQEQR